MNIRSTHLLSVFVILCCITILRAGDKPKPVPIHTDRPLEETLLDRLKQAKLAQFNLKDVPVKSAFFHLNEQLKRIDPAGKGFNILYKCKKESQLRSIAIDVRETPVSELIYFICMKAHLNYRIEKHAIVVWDIKKGEKMNKY